MSRGRGTAGDAVRESRKNRPSRAPWPCFPGLFLLPGTVYRWPCTSSVPAITSATRVLRMLWIALVVRTDCLVMLPRHGGLRGGTRRRAGCRPSASMRAGCAGAGAGGGLLRPGAAVDAALGHPYTDKLVRVPVTQPRDRGARSRSRRPRLLRRAHPRRPDEQHQHPEDDVDQRLPLLSSCSCDPEKLATGRVDTRCRICAHHGSDSRC